MRAPAAALLIAALCAVLAGWAAARPGGAVAPSTAAPVVVGATRLPAAALAATAAAGPAAADRAIERAWLEGEARARGLRPARGIEALRGQVADAIAGRGALPAGRVLQAAFDAFHARWRERTRCLPAYRDPYEDRCGDGAPASAGTCRWLGEATLCHARRRWVVVRRDRSRAAARTAAARLPRPLARRLRRAGGTAIAFRSRASALRVARALYGSARERRARAAAQARAIAAAAAAERARSERDAQRAAALDARRADPRPAAAVAAAARSACAVEVRASEPYMFGFGMQDVAGGAAGLIEVREALARRLERLDADAVDRAKLRPLVRAIRAGNRALARMAAAADARDYERVEALAAHFDADTAPERDVSVRLGLGDCLARPGR